YERQWCDGGVVERVTTDGCTISVGAATPSAPAPATTPITMFALLDGWRIARIFEIPDADIGRRYTAWKRLIREHGAALVVLPVGGVVGDRVIVDGNGVAIVMR